jgi:DNA repair protein Rad10
MLVSRRQMGNPVLNLIKNVRWEFADIVPDYMIGQNAAALFLSLRWGWGKRGGMRMQGTGRWGGLCGVVW